MDGQEEYVRQVMEAYRKTPGTMGTVRRADRLLAEQLHQRGLSVKVIENALVPSPKSPGKNRPKHRPWARFARWPISCLSLRKCWRRTSARSTSNISGTSSHAPRHVGERASGADDGNHPARLRRG